MNKSVPLKGPFTTADAERNGVSRNALARLLRAGGVVKHRPDLYWNASEFETTPPWERHALAAIRVQTAIASDVVIARVAAACLQGLAIPLPLRDGREELHFYTVNTQTARTRTGLHIYCTPLPTSEVTTARGVAVTTVARTAIDLARAQPLPKALIVIDSALRIGTTAADLDRQCAAQTGWVGVAAAKTAIRFSNSASESPLESESRGYFIGANLPSPHLQALLLGASGREYRVDFYWPELNLIGEADGWGKFGTTPAEREAAFRREKLREDDLRNAGYRVIRWTHQTIPNAVVTIRRIAQLAA